MPQLVKGGKYVFGISLIGEQFEIQIPLEAHYEYGLYDSKFVILIAGSNTSGGFSINPIPTIRVSKLSNVLKELEYNLEDKKFGVPEKSIVNFKNRIISWIELNGKATFHLNQSLAAKLGIGIAEKLVVVRGSNLGPGFIARGPIYDEAMIHSELNIF